MNGNQSGVELRTMDAIVFQIQDGRHKFQPIRSRIKNSRWRRPRKSAMLENCPPSLDGRLGSVSRISMATQITLGSRKIVMQLQTRYLQCPVVLNDEGPSGKWPWWRPRDLGPSLAYIGWCKASWDDDLIDIQSEYSQMGFPSPLC